MSSLTSVLQQIKEDDYKTELKTLKGSSIGKHVRHIIEFYECLLFKAVDNTINYDDRKRNVQLEENLKYTSDYIVEIIDCLSNIKSNKRLILKSRFQDINYAMESSLYREINYNIEHTVHHLAIISIAIPLHFPYIDLSENFGYAASTIAYLKEKN